MKYASIILICAVVMISVMTAHADDSGFARIIVKLSSMDVASSGSEFDTSIDSLVSSGIIYRQEPVFSESLNEQYLSASDGGGFPYGLYHSVVFESSEDISPEEIISIIESIGGVEYAEPDYFIQLFDVPNDPHVENQWGLQNTGQEYLGINRIDGYYNDELVMKSGDAGADINMGPIWDDYTPRPRPLVVIIDTGIDTEHPDIADNVWENPLEIPDNGIDDDHNGYIDDVKGWDFSGDESDLFNTEGDNDVSDYRGHGTHCAGIIGAVSDNGIGVAGICPYADIVGLKIFPLALMSVASRAIIYAADMGAEVVNMSWGSPYASRFLEESLEYAKSKGVFLVAASGNSGDASRLFPSSLDIVMTVGASNSNDEVTHFSTYGDWIDIIAPGRDILSLRAQGTDLYEEGYEPEVRIIDSDYYLADGTSMAAPHAVGAAAVVLSYSPGLDPDELKDILQQSADDVIYPYGDTDSTFPGWDRYSGYGRLNVGAAVAMLSGRMAKILYPYVGEMITDNIEIEGYAYSEHGEDYTLRIAPSTDPTNWTVINQGTADKKNTTLGSLDITGLAGEYILEINIGTEFSTQRSITVVSERRFELTSPSDMETVKWFLTVRGSILDPEFESYSVDIRPGSNPNGWVNIYSSTEYVADSIICAVSIGQFRSGDYTLRVNLQTENGDDFRDIEIQIEDNLHGIFPRTAALDSSVHIGPAVYDLDGNGTMEIAVGSEGGVSVFRSDGGAFCCGWPNLFGINCFSPPAIADMDGDGLAEVAVISEKGLHLFDAYGAKIDSFPKYHTTGLLSSSYPTPLLADFDGDSIKEATWIAEDGNVYAYRLNGRSYFASRNGLFAMTEAGYYYGSYDSPFLSCLDFEGDGSMEVVAGYSSYYHSGAIYAWKTSNGEALSGYSSAQIASLGKLRGVCIADFDADGIYDIAAVGRTENDTVYAAIMDHHGNYLEGWPRLFPEKWNVLVSAPAAADLDDDGFPELIFTISSLFNKGEICVLKYNAEPFRPILSGDGSWLVTVNGSLGAPVIGDVSGDGRVDIVVRAGSVLPGMARERILAFDTEGLPIDGWPIYTFANPNGVFHNSHIPALVDLDSDGMLDIVMTSDDRQVYAWKLEVPYDEDAVPWPQFMHDSRHSGILPGRGYSTAADSPEDSDILPTEFQLSQNYPNPFNPSTRIDFTVPRTGPIRIEIFNILGRKVRTLQDGVVEIGEHTITWDGTDDSGEDVASGLYLYRLESGTVVETRKMVKLK